MLPSQITRSLISNTQFSTSSALLRVTNNAMNTQQGSLLDSKSLVKKVVELPTQNTAESTSNKTKIFTASFQKQVNTYMQEQSSSLLHSKQKQDSPSYSLDPGRKRKASSEENDVKMQKTVVSNNEDSDSDYGLSGLYAQANKWETKGNNKCRTKKQGSSMRDSEKRSLKPKHSKPNYFLAVRLNNQCIHEKVNSIQDHIRDRNKAMEKCFVPIPTLHMTLCVMTLSSVEDQQKVASALSLSCSRISNILEETTQTVQLKYENLSTFNGQVLYIDLVKDQGLSTISKIVVELKRCLTELKIDFKQEEFNPHLTVMKMSRCQKQMRKAGIKRISPKLYEKFKEETFGTDVVRDIQLCSMVDKKASDGFYKVLAKIDFNNPTDVQLVDMTKEKLLNVFDLASYDVLPKWEEEVANFTVDSSWYEITNKEKEEVKRLLVDD